MARDRPRRVQVGWRPGELSLLAPRKWGGSTNAQAPPLQPSPPHADKQVAVGPAEPHTNKHPNGAIRAQHLISLRTHPVLTALHIAHL